MSGWSYPRWRGDFYPAGLPAAAELAFATERLTTVEVNATFYRLQSPATFGEWRRAARPGTVIAVKGSRFVTHMKRLRDADRALARFFGSGVLQLGATLGPFLWQLPATMPFEADRVGAFLDLLPRTRSGVRRLIAAHLSDEDRPATALPRSPAGTPQRLRQAIEARHASFGDAAALRLLERHGVALVLADSGGRFPPLDAGTADFRYVRLHGPTELYRGGYSEAELDAWAARTCDWAARGEDVYVYFDNDGDGRAPFDAYRLAERIGGLQTADGATVRALRSGKSAPAVPPSRIEVTTMATTKQRAAARKNIESAQAAAKAKKSISHMSAAKRTALGKQAAAVAKRNRTGASEPATRAELYEQAKRRNIRGRSKMGRAELARALGRK